MTTNKNNKRTTTTTTSTGGTTTTTVENCHELPNEQLLRNRAELLREKYLECIGVPMSMAILRQLLLSLINGTPWEYYEYALGEAALAPSPSWRYVMAIINRLITQGVSVEQLHSPKPVRQPYKVVEHQQYTQRDYYHSEDPMDRMMAEYFAERR